MADRPGDLHVIARNTFAYHLFPLTAGVEAPRGWARASDSASADAVFLVSPVEDTRAEELVEAARASFLPVVSLYGGGAPWYDGIFKEPCAEAFELAARIVARVRELPVAARRDASADVALLARLYTRDAGLRASYDPYRREVVCYRLMDGMGDVVAVANALTDRALLSRTFFDRVHVCPGCGGSRLNVREECVSCRSADVAEEPTVHHYKCGHVAREGAFRGLGRFECPKCGEALRHIGLDYDKPGIVIACNDCHALNDATAVGFRCMDCGSTANADQVPTRDWHDYELTAQGARYLLKGDYTSHAPSLPQAFGALLRQAMLEARTFDTPYVMTRLRFSAREQLERQAPALWPRVKNLALDCVHSALREVDSVCEAQEEFLILFPRADRQRALRAVEDIKRRLSEVLRHDPGIVAEILTPAQQLVYLNGRPEGERGAA